ncbi:tRNA-splicing endonuclease subunit, partial [Rhizophlyctis rosea]
MPLQNTFFGLPLALLPEEVTLLLEKGLAILVDDSLAHKTPTEAQLDLRKTQTAEELRKYEEDRRAAADAIRAAKIAQYSEKNKKKEKTKKAATVEDAALASTASAESTSDVVGRATASKEAADLSVLLSPESAADETTTHKYARDTPQPAPAPALLPTQIPLPVATPTSSNSLPWFDEESGRVPPSGKGMTTLEDAKQSGLWTWPETEAEKLRYRVFRGLWEKGYYISSGSKFGGDYLLYPGDPLRYHSHFVASVVAPDRLFTPLDAVSFGRLGTTVKKSHA